jgi:hypothetical protein
MRSSATDWRLVGRNTVLLAAALLLAIAAMVGLGVVEGTPEPLNTPSVAPGPVKWSHS